MTTKIVATIIRRMAFLLSFFYCLTGYADIVDLEQARDVATQFMKSHNEAMSRSKEPLDNIVMELVYSSDESKTGYPLLYVFNCSMGGFVIVSGDDCTDSVLGYSENGKFNEKEMPDNFRWWLSEYEKTMHDRIGKGLTKQEMTNAEANQEAIEPLLTSKWHQGAPYNNLCPLVQNNERCFAGCGAIALAQILYYHKWPQKGFGSHSYNTRYTNISVTFEGTQYDWDAMHDVEDPNTTSNAVGTLVYHVGVALETKYSTTGSGINMVREDIHQAIKNHFGCYAEHVTRTSLNDEAVRQMLLDDLNKRRPVMYSGGTHVFVLDGFRDGYYHINWGWGGGYDGYFLLTALNPGDKDYNDIHEILCHIKPYGMEQEVIEIKHKERLESIIGQSGIRLIKQMKLSGTIDGSDMLVLRTMAGRDMKNNPTDGLLTELNLTDVRITNGGDQYLDITNFPQKGTKSDIMPEQGFLDTQLTHVWLPKGVKLYGRWAFAGATNLQVIEVPYTNPMAISKNVFPNSCYKNATLIVPDGCTSVYKNTEGWQNFVNITEQQNINNGIRFVENDNSYNKVGIYTIQGVMMKRIPPVRHEESLDLELSDLPKGIYIVNGRKMVNR